MTSVERRISTNLPVKFHLRPLRARSESLPPPQSLSQLIQGLHYIFEDTNIEVEEVKQYLGSYKNVKEEWAERAAFDKHKYTRNLIDEGNGKFNLILLCWKAGQKSRIHDHSDSHCFMKILEGSLKETLYSWPNGTGPMVPKATTVINHDEVVYINDSIGLHRIENPSETADAVSLHIYSPPFDMCQTFDEKNGSKIECKMTFHTRFGKNVSTGNVNCAD